MNDKKYRETVERPGWAATLMWFALSVLAFVILFRLGLRAAQARRMAWLLAVAVSFCAASRALIGEMRVSARCSPALMGGAGAIGGCLIAAWMDASAGLGLEPVGLLLGTLGGGGLGYLLCRWKR